MWAEWIDLYSSMIDYLFMVEITVQLGIYISPIFEL